MADEKRYQKRMSAAAARDALSMALVKKHLAGNITKAQFDKALKALATVTQTLYPPIRQGKRRR